MNRHSQDTTKLQLAGKLSDEHDGLEQWFLQLAERAATGDPRECDALWSNFAKKLENHMAFEEREIFPGYSQKGVVEASIVQLLLAEHAALREQLTTLGVDLQLHLTNAPVINAFIARLRDHARRERETVYPWLKARKQSAAAAADTGAAG